MPIDPVARAVTAYKLIADKQLSVVFKTTAGVALAAQTVRLNSDNSVSEAESAAGLAPRRQVVIYGVTAHPSAAVNDIKVGYRFVLGNTEYRVVSIIPQTPGVVQAIAEATG